MERESAVFALFDAARMGGDLEHAQILAEDYASLYEGHGAQVLAAFAPYLFPFPSESALSQWFFAHGWGHNWGVFCYSAASPNELRHHLRRFLKVGLEDAKPFYFRFYDPRVLRVFLPTCNVQQLKAFFGPIDYFWMEDDDPTFGLYFLLDGDKLLTHRVSRRELEFAFS